MERRGHARWYFLLAISALLLCSLQVQHAVAATSVEAGIVESDARSESNIASSDKSRFTPTLGNNLLLSQPAGPKKVRSSRVLIVRFFDDNGLPLALSKVNNVAKVDLFVGNALVASFSPSAPQWLNAGNDSYLWIPLNFDEVKAAPEGTPVKLVTAFSDGQNPETRHAQVWDFGVPYGSGIGIWIPVGLFSYTGDKTSDGAVWSALPVNVGLGRKWYFNGRKEDYVGGSFITSVIASTRDDDKRIVADAHLGFFVDLTGALYLGGTYIWDLRDGSKNPGLAFVFGVGPRLFEMLGAGN